MATLQITTTLLGLGLAALILLLVRRDRLYLLHGLFWVLVAVAAALLGAWPGLIDALAALLGIAYPPTLLLLLSCLLLLIKALHTDIVNTRIERDVRRLNQRIALLEANLVLAGHSVPEHAPLGTPSAPTPAPARSTHD